MLFIHSVPPAAPAGAPSLARSERREGSAVICWRDVTGNFQIWIRKVAPKVFEVAAFGFSSGGEERYFYFQRKDVSLQRATEGFDDSVLLLEHRLKLAEPRALPKGCAEKHAEEPGQLTNKEPIKVMDVRNTFIF